MPDRADPAGALYLLGSGRVRLFQPDPDGERTTLLYLRVGDLFRLEAGEDTGQSLHEAVTHEESLIYCIDPARLRLPTEALLAIEQAARVQLQRQLRAAFERISDLSCYSLPDRVRRILGRAQREFGQAEVPLTHAEMADLAGPDRAEMTKVLWDLKTRGIVAYDRGRCGIRLLNP